MKACVFTLGCKVNFVESASVMRGLEERGYEVTDRLQRADLYIINTCSVTAEAEKKSRQAIARMRKFNPAAPVVVMGCASERDGEAFARRAGVKLVTGAQGKDNVLSLLDSGAEGLFPQTDRAFCELPPPKQTRTRAYLRIQDGCDRFCSYCIIPYLRGRTRSRSVESIVREASEIEAPEIVLTGIDISAYRDGDRGLGDLLLALRDIPARIRLGSLEEGVVDEGFLQKVGEAGNVVPHFHLSLQSGSDAVLKAMNRHYTREDFLECCRMIYGMFPDAGISTDMIVGFPTETDREFEQSLSVIGEAGFARTHCFPYSARPGTVAAKMKDLPAELKRERVTRMIREAGKVQRAFQNKFLGTVRTVVLEETGGYTDNYIRVYTRERQEGTVARVRLVSPFRDGVNGEIVEILKQGENR